MDFKKSWSSSTLSLSIFIFIIFFGVLSRDAVVSSLSKALSPISPALAAGVVDLRGWAWSSNIGWISFNSANPGAGGGASYKVTYDQGGTERLRGFAWSSTGLNGGPTGIGWISFEDADVEGCPDDPTNVNPNLCYPKVNTGTGYVEGWARALSGVTPPSFNFSLSNGGDVSVEKGSSILNTITSTLASGATQSVSFSVSGLPAGATAVFSPNSCNPTCSSTMTISTTAATPTGSTVITVTGTAGAIVRTTTFRLTVTAPACPAPLFISLHTNNYNIWTVVGSTWSAGCPVVLTINAGVVVGSNSILSPALTTGAFPSGTSITIINNGTIVGKGGNGGNGGMTGQNGGDAISLALL
ncbi:MAG: hypothetical protein AAB545_00625, partial [Patescibacteria group bacterium]